MHLSNRFAWRSIAALSLAWPFACAAQDELFVSNSNSNAITVYARTASGNTAPIRVLQGAATGLSSPSGLAVDLVNDELIVANKTVPYSVTIYPRTASGNTAPLRTIIGNLTTLDDPRGVAVDSLHGEAAIGQRLGMQRGEFVDRRGVERAVVEDAHRQAGVFGQHVRQVIVQQVHHQHGERGELRR